MTAYHLKRHQYITLIIIASLPYRNYIGSSFLGCFCVMHYVVKCTPQQAKALASAGQPFPSHALQKCGNAVEIDIRVVIFMFEGYHRGFF